MRKSTTDTRFCVSKRVLITALNGCNLAQFLLHSTSKLPLRVSLQEDIGVV